MARATTRQYREPWPWLPVYHAGSNIVSITEMFRPPLDRPWYSSQGRPGRHRNFERIPLFAGTVRP